MSWSEKLSIRIAKKLVSNTDASHTVGQVSHGIEIFLLYLLTVLSLAVCSWFLNSFSETIVLSFFYFLFRNFTGGVHLSNPHSCFIVGNILALSLGLAVKHMPTTNFLFASITIMVAVVFSFVVNWRYAPANHTYVQISDEAKRKSKRIVTTFLILGCPLAYFLLYFNYYNLAYAYSFAVLLQALLLHPLSFHLVKRFEKTFLREGVER
ncbi:accessory gene regulator ArgB-like protein [Brevibacillus fluminis]|uniref:accessory gene regulator ArgB-like protein n=1 Tax=Brevibacillus fluminis TaxID=511487 RepID=UPI003F89EE1B